MSPPAILAAEEAGSSEVVTAGIAGRILNPRSPDWELKDRCDYSSSLTENARVGREGSQAREGTLSAVATLAHQITESRGQLSDAQIAAAREAGLTDSKIVEVIAQVTLLNLTNYLNNVATTDIDFPPSAR